MPKTDGLIAYNDLCHTKLIFTHKLKPSQGDNSQKTYFTGYIPFIDLQLEVVGETKAPPQPIDHCIHNTNK